MEGRWVDTPVDLDKVEAVCRAVYPQQAVP